MKNKTYYYFLSLLIICFSLFGCIEGGASPSAAGKGYRVSYVIDGDTIQLSNGSKVRYLCVDTPETRKRVGVGWVYDPEPYAAEAKKCNESLVGGKNVRLEFDVERKDKYDRLLAYVYVDGKMVNEELLRRGYASILAFPPNLKHIERLVKARDDARQHKKGVWSEIETISPQETKANMGEICVVKGKCFSMTFSSHAVLLNFSKTPGDGFTAVIYTSNLALFEQAGIDLEEQYIGKPVEIIGKIRAKGGPQIIVYHPSQIKVIQ